MSSIFQFCAFKDNRSTSKVLAFCFLMAIMQNPNSYIENKADKTLKSLLRQKKDYYLK